MKKLWSRTSTRCRFMLRLTETIPITTAKQLQCRLQSTISLPEKSTVFSGIQPTGIPHLGNYLGALQQWVQLQNAAPHNTKLLYSIVDSHALTQCEDAVQLRQWKRETLAVLLAIGLDPERSILFYQSSVKAHAELMWVLSCKASFGYLSRMTQWKTKAQISDDEEPSSSADTTHSTTRKVGLFTYPILQAADILVHRATHVPVGEDQRQHLEFARECATNFNASYSRKRNTRRILLAPDTILSEAKRVMSLRNPHVKMSKSDADTKSRILLTDTPEDIRAKIKIATTDSISRLVTYNPTTRPGVSNLLELLSYFDVERRSPQMLGELHATSDLKGLKEIIGDVIATHLAPIRQRYKTVMAEDGGKYLDDIAHRGGVKARRSAEETMVLVREAIGYEKD